MIRKAAHPEHENQLYDFIKNEKERENHRFDGLLIPFRVLYYEEEGIELHFVAYLPRFTMGFKNSYVFASDLDNNIDDFKNETQWLNLDNAKSIRLTDDQAHNLITDNSVKGIDHQKLVERDITVYQLMHRVKFGDGEKFIEELELAKLKKRFPKLNPEEIDQVQS